MNILILFVLLSIAAGAAVIFAVNKFRDKDKEEWE